MNSTHYFIAPSRTPKISMANAFKVYENQDEHSNCSGTKNYSETKSTEFDWNQYVSISQH
jgi:hypothetical protein